MKIFLLFILLLALLVSLHEWGHYIVAKKSGVFVREFSIGMGSKLFVKVSGGTKYTLRVLPVGGYVQMASRGEQYPMIQSGRRVYIEEGDDGKISNFYEDAGNRMLRPVIIKEWEEFGEMLTVQDMHNEGYETLHVAKLAGCYDTAGNGHIIVPEEGWIESQSVWRRIMIYAAGPFMNIVLAFSLFMGVGLITGSPSTDAVIGSISPDQPISETILEDGDTILTIDNESVSSFSDIGNIVGERAGDTVLVEFSRDGDIISDSVVIGDQDGTGVLGVRVHLEKGLGQAFKSAGVNTWIVFESIISSIVQLFSDFDINMLGGPVYMMQSTGSVGASAESTSGAIASYAIWGAIVSINLAAVNLIPIPALDGGRILIALIEGIRRKPISASLEMKLNLASALLMLILMFAITMNDLFFR